MRSDANMQVIAMNFGVSRDLADTINLSNFDVD